MGIGKAIVQGFLQQGANVSYCSRSSSLKEFEDFARAIDGAQAVGSKVDITDIESVESWVQTSAEKFGGIDIVVANGKSFSSLIREYLN